MASTLSGNYPLSRPTGVCAATGQSLSPGTPYIASLVERDGQDSLERQDFSVAAWEQGHRPAPPFTLFGSWRAAMPTGTEQRRALLGDDELLDIFEQLAAGVTPDAILNSESPAAAAPVNPAVGDPPNPSAAQPANVAARHEVFRYVLALLLLRRRLLVLEGGRPGLMILRPRRRAGEAAATLPTFEISDPSTAGRLDPDALAAAIEQIGALMPDPAPTSASGSAPA